MIVYQISKNKLTNRDFKYVKQIEYNNDRFLIVQIYPRKIPNTERKKIIVSAPATERNWQLFREVYFKKS